MEGAGDFFPPNLFNAKSIKLYSNDLCRSIVLNATTDGEEKGVAGVEYRFDFCRDLHFSFTPKDAISKIDI